MSPSKPHTHMIGNGLRFTHCFKSPMRADFYHEVLDVIKARVDHNNVPETNIDVIKLEITGSRAAHSMAQPDVCCAIIRAIIDRCGLPLASPLTQTHGLGAPLLYRGCRGCLRCRAKGSTLVHSR